jgi:hypothetical protein
VPPTATTLLDPTAGPGEEPDLDPTDLAVVCAAAPPGMQSSSWPHPPPPSPWPPRSPSSSRPYLSRPCPWPPSVLSLVRGHLIRRGLVRSHLCHHGFLSRFCHCGFFCCTHLGSLLSHHRCCRDLARCRDGPTTAGPTGCNQHRHRVRMWRGSSPRCLLPNSWGPLTVDPPLWNCFVLLCRGTSSSSDNTSVLLRTT